MMAGAVAGPRWAAIGQRICRREHALGSPGTAPETVRGVIRPVCYGAGIFTDHSGDGGYTSAPFTLLGAQEHVVMKR
jgi:hypothetical protein